ncbi:MAG: 6-bladed beta-propeller [Caldilineaceae bacterium]|nr:6-bladed beta-propeller [Caldilineaceae bacterium]
MIRQIFYSLLLLILLAANTIPAPVLRAESLGISGEIRNELTAEMPQIPTANAARPLPGGCPGSTPGGGTPPCCISGIIFVNGQPVAGAEVEIRSAQGEHVLLLTHLFTDTLTSRSGDQTDPRPYYSVNLTEALKVDVGDTITITAHYTESATAQWLTKEVSYQIKPGSQQVDLALRSPTTGDYVVDQTIWYAAGPGQLDDAQGVALDGDGNLYIADSANHRVQVFDALGNFLRQWGTLGTGSGEFTNPTAVDVGHDGRVYVLDADNHSLQVFESDGTFVMAWGQQVEGVTLFQRWDTIAVDAQNRLFVTDVSGDRIHRFGSNGEWERSWGGSGEGDVQFHGLRSLALARDSGRLYTVESYNVGQVPENRTAGRIQVFDLDGNWLATWDDPTGSGGDWDVSNLATDRAGNLYAADDSSIHLMRSDGTIERSWPIDDARYSRFGVGSGPTFYIAAGWAFQVFDHTGKLVATLGSTETADGHFQQPVQPTDAGFAATPNGHLAVLFDEHNQIGSLHLFDLGSGDWITTSHASNSLTWPTAVVNWQEDLYVLDNFRNRIEWYNTAGERISGYNLPSGQFSHLAVDDMGRIFAATNFTKTIYLLDPIQAIPPLTTISLQSTAPEIGRITGLAIDHENRLYVAESGCDCVGRFTLEGLPLDDFGLFIGGVPSNALNERISSVQVDENGAIYVRSTIGLVQYNSEGDQLRSLPFTGFVTDDGVMVQMDEWGRILMRRPTGKPVATINHLSSTYGVLEPGDILVLTGMGQDSDATDSIQRFVWSSDQDGILSESAVLTLTTATISLGQHLISLRVQDDEGDWSEPVTWELEITDGASSPDLAWGMLLYLAGDQNDRGHLLNRFRVSLERLQKSLDNPNVRIAVQLDGPGRNDAKRLLITPKTDQSPAQIVEIATPQEAMDDPETLLNFVIWAQETLPAQRYYLAIADHGQALQGIAWDQTSDLANNGVLDYDAYLTVKELAAALNDDRLKPIDILHLDACSMALLEVAYELKNAANLLISSQYLAWDYFLYDRYAQLLTAAQPSEEIAIDIMHAYAQKASSGKRSYTLSVLDLRQIDGVIAALDALAATLLDLYKKDEISGALLEEAVTGVQTFDTNEDYLNNDQDIYIDLLDWLYRLDDRVSQPTLKAQIESLTRHLTGETVFILANTYQTAPMPAPGRPGIVELSRATGVSIAYWRTPTGEIFGDYNSDLLFSFTAISHWNELLDALPGSLGGAPMEFAGPIAPLLSDTENEFHSLFLPNVTR